MIPHVHFLVNANVNAMEVRAYIDRIESFSCLDKKGFVKLNAVRVLSLLSTKSLKSGKNKMWVIGSDRNLKYRVPTAIGK